MLDKILARLGLCRRKNVMEAFQRLHRAEIDNGRISDKAYTQAFQVALGQEV